MCIYTGNKHINTNICTIICICILLTTNAYATGTLVYDGGGPQSQVQAAMGLLGITYDLRDPGNPVTVADLASHDVLIVGWNFLGDMSGLSDSVLADGITGNILLTGHDADVHTVQGYDYTGNPADSVGVAANTFMSQAISFAATGGGAGLVALGDMTTAFSYLPDEWGINATGNLLEETVTSFTPDGLASGVYDGLTPASMSNWWHSYHAEFNSFSAHFTPFEFGGTGQNLVTIARVIPAPGAVLLSGLGATLVGWLRRRRTL